MHEPCRIVCLAIVHVHYTINNNFIHWFMREIIQVTSTVHSNSTIKRTIQLPPPINLEFLVAGFFFVFPRNIVKSGQSVFAVVKQTHYGSHTRTKLVGRISICLGITLHPTPVIFVDKSIFVFGQEETVKTEIGRVHSMQMRKLARKLTPNDLCVIAYYFCCFLPLTQTTNAGECIL